MKRLLSFLMLMCLAATPMFAAPQVEAPLGTPQPGVPQRGWEVLRAEYGSGYRWVDVTERVRSLIQNDFLNFRVTNSTLGVDPRPGVSKTLRLQLQDRNGRTRQLSFEENSLVRLRTFDRNPGGSLQITRAVYGAGRRWVDVTARLNSRIRGNQLNLPVNDYTMGSDPAMNRIKTLRVDYTFGGRVEQVVVNEGDMLRLNPAVGNYQSRLQITRALYGAGNRWADVTNRLNSQIRGNQLNLPVTNYTMGVDPAQNRAKTLRVDYTFGGRLDQVVVNEGDTLRLNPAMGNYQSRLQITRAFYGADSRWVDVTSRLNSRIEGNQLHVQVNNYTMGVDPAQNRAKALRVDYTFDGRANQVVVNEGDTLRLNPSTSQSSRSIRCESEYGNRKYCPFDTHGGVRLARQISNAACIQGSTWGYTSRGVWVSEGCRADFEVLAEGQLTGESIYTLIPSGTQLAVVTNENIDSRTAGEGQRFSAQVDSDVVDSWGNVAIPRGSLVQLAIRRAATDGNHLTLDVDSVTVAGTRYLVSTGDLTQKGGQGLGANKKTAVMVGGGAALGTLIGAIAGGGKGAAIGAAVGAGAGAGGVVLTRGRQVSVPAETILNFRLDQDLSLMAGR